MISKKLKEENARFGRYQITLKVFVPLLTSYNYWRLPLKDDRT
jgi:hypothetical protein